MHNDCILPDQDQTYATNRIAIAIRLCNECTRLKPDILKLAVLNVTPCITSVKGKRMKPVTSASNNL